MRQAQRRAMPLKPPYQTSASVLIKCTTGQFSPSKHLCLLPAMVAQWSRRCVAEPKDRGSIPSAVAAFLTEVKSVNALCGDISAR